MGVSSSLSRDLQTIAADHLTGVIGAFDQRQNGAARQPDWHWNSGPPLGLLVGSGGDCRRANFLLLKSTGQRFGQLRDREVSI
jgi:hypothetical protein